MSDTDGSTTPSAPSLAKVPHPQLQRQEPTSGSASTSSPGTRSPNSPHTTTSTDHDGTVVAQSRERGWRAKAHVHTIPSRSMLAIDRLEGSDKGPAADHADGGYKGGRWGSDNGVPFRPPETLMR